MKKVIGITVGLIIIVCVIFSAIFNSARRPKI